MKRFYTLLVVALFSLSQVACIADSEDKTVLLAILARNKAHVLPHYLKCIENLDYDKSLITVYVNTNNNEDETAELLENWIQCNGDQYSQIVFDNHEIQGLIPTTPHQWTGQRFKVLGRIRDKSMQMAIKHNCDYYFVVDCDNFITPCTLKELIQKEKPIIAPMLRAIPESFDNYSNYFCDIDANGYYKDHPDYLKILNREIKGTFKVPVAHCTYLIDTNYIDNLRYVDKTDDFEFVIFSREARKNGVDQYICNEHDFGELVHFHDVVTLDEERKQVSKYFETRDKDAMEVVFANIYDKGIWGRDSEGRGTSGDGASVENAKTYMKFLEGFLADQEIQSVVDIGCGDWSFSKEIDWRDIRYLGIDVVENLIERNQKQFSTSQIQFLHGNALKMDLPEADLLLCKDVLQHFTNADISAFLNQTKKFKHCLITNDVELETLGSTNEDVRCGDYRTLDLTKPPFNVKGLKIFTYRIGNSHVKQVLHITKAEQL